MQESTDANAQRDPVPQAGSLPFFARFLEGQNEEERSAATTKFPSDLDEYTTNKYPSDGDDGRPDDFSLSLSATERRRGAQTLKYPSDRDEWDPFLNS